MNRQQGFSLIELLIVVATILILVAIAIPNLLRAKIAANEASAMRTVREISTAEAGYHAVYPTVGFAPTLVRLGGAAPCAASAATACILDDQVSSGLKSGYLVFAAGFATPGSLVNTDFVASTAPLAFNQSGVRDFCMASDGVLRISPGAPGVTPASTMPACLAYPIAQ